MKMLKTVIFLLVIFLIPVVNSSIQRSPDVKTLEQNKYMQIDETIKKGDTLFTIFKRYKLELKDLLEIREASAGIHNLRELSPGRPYKLSIDMDNRINSFVYFFDDDAFLNVVRSESGFKAEKIPLDYEVHTNHIGGTIKDNLISSIGDDKENTLLALEITDIFSWDIDFSTDIQNGDTFKIVVEALHLDGKFKKYGNILAVEFMNNGKRYSAYRFIKNGKADYYDSRGKSVRKAFLKAPLSFKRISSYFAGKRLHPILKIHRPHHGVDYAAPSGTPVSATGSGIVVFAGYRGAYGKLVVIKHKNNYKTYYGHLSKIFKNIKKGVAIDQGSAIGCVGRTGLATGPHLHYEMRVAGRYVNPLDAEHPFKEAVTGHSLIEFTKVVDSMNKRFASIPVSNPVFAEETLKKERG
jgi:murein DD-endopeptidase MepM/ murein hydrolase activator NlpD